MLQDPLQTLVYCNIVIFLQEKVGFLCCQAFHSSWEDSSWEFAVKNEPGAVCRESVNPLDGSAEPGTQDSAMRARLQDLKRRNAALAADLVSAQDALQACQTELAQLREVNAALHPRPFVHRPRSFVRPAVSFMFQNKAHFLA